MPLRRAARPLALLSVEPHPPLGWGWHRALASGPVAGSASYTLRSGCTSYSTSTRVLVTRPAGASGDQGYGPCGPVDFKFVRGPLSACRHRASWCLSVRLAACHDRARGPWRRMTTGASGKESGKETRPRSFQSTGTGAVPFVCHTMPQRHRMPSPTCPSGRLRLSLSSVPARPSYPYP